MIEPDDVNGPGPEVFARVVEHARTQTLHMRSLQQRAMAWLADENDRLRALNLATLDARIARLEARMPEPDGR